MKTANLTMTIVHDHQGRAKNGREAMLEVRVTHLRRHVFVSTGIKVRKSEWVAGRIVDRMDAKLLNERLAIIYNKVGEEVNAAISEGRPLNAHSIRERVFQIVEEQRSNHPLLDWIDKTVRNLTVKPDTRKHYVTLQNRLDEFGRMLRWDDVTVERICDFDTWLHALRPTGDDGGAVAFGRLKDGLSDGAVYTYHKCLKALLNKAEIYGLIQYNPYRKLRGHFKRGDRPNTEYLTVDEMQRLWKMPLPDDALLERARDLFVFQMFTGMSYGDTQAFDLSSTKYEEGRWRQHGRRIKTDVDYLVELLPPAEEVVRKYGGRVPHIDNADYNKALKVLGFLAKINIRMHSHLGRHSFATMMLRQGAKIENVARMLGHTNITQTQRYAKVLEVSVLEDFEKVRKTLPRPLPVMEGRK